MARRTSSPPDDFGLGRLGIANTPIGALVINWEFPGSVFRLHGKTNDGMLILRYISGPDFAYHGHEWNAGWSFTALALPLRVMLPEGV